MWDSKRDTDVKNSLLDSVGEGKCGMVWEGGVETCILSYAKRITGMTLGDGMGRVVGGVVQDREHMYTHGWFMSTYGKNHYNIVK